MDVLVVGIDVSMDRLDVAVRPTGESLTVWRTDSGIDDLIARLKTLAPKLIAIEATGGDVEAGKAILRDYKSPVYPKIGEKFAHHHAVNHSGNEYARLC